MGYVLNDVKLITTVSLVIFFISGAKYVQTLTRKLAKFNFIQTSKFSASYQFKYCMVRLFIQKRYNLGTAQRNAIWLIHTN